MSSSLIFDPIRLPVSCHNLRREARAFLAEEISKGTFDPSNPRRGEEAVRRCLKGIGSCASHSGRSSAQQLH